MASHPPIPVMDLAEHLEHLKANDNLKFSQEYEVSRDNGLAAVRRRQTIRKASGAVDCGGHRR